METVAKPPPAPPAASIRRNLSWTLAGNVGYALCQWGMLVVLARLETPEMVGQFALALALTAPVFLLTGLHLRGAQATDARHEYRFTDYFRLRLLGSSAGLLAVGAIAAAHSGRPDLAAAILLIGAAKAVESVSDVLHGNFQQRERLDLIAKARLIKGPLGLAAFAAAVRLTGGLAWGAVGLGSAWLAVLLFWEIPAFLALAKGERSSGSPCPGRPRGKEPPTLLRLAWLTLPLGVVMMFVSLTSAVPRWYLDRFQGEAVLGIFASIAYLMTAGGLIVTAMGESLLPRLAQHYAAGDGCAFRSKLLRAIGVAALLGLGGILTAIVVGRELLTLLYGPLYGDHSRLLVWIMSAATITYVSSLLGYSVTATRRFRVQILLSGAACTVAALSCQVLVPRHGAVGAAWALMATACVHLLLSGAVLRRALKALPVKQDAGGLHP